MTIIYIVSNVFDYHARIFSRYFSKERKSFNYYWDAVKRKLLVWHNIQVKNSDRSKHFIIKFNYFFVIESLYTLNLNSIHQFIR